MNPDKLFDYLDGKLSPADREALEEKLMSDTQLRRQFNIARDIHRSGGDKREVIMPSEDPAAMERASRLGRGIAIGAIALVFLNVIVGLAVITARNKKPARPSQKETEIRRQLSDSLGAAAKNAMPPPIFTAGEIEITAPRAEWKNIANKIIAGAASFEGSAVKGIPDEKVVTVMAEIPSNREAEFREAVSAASSVTPMPAIAAGTTQANEKSNEKTIIQIRITEARAR